jgi:hypothetical protein
MLRESRRIVIAQRSRREDQGATIEAKKSPVEMTGRGFTRRKEVACATPRHDGQPRPCDRRARSLGSLIGFLFRERVALNLSETPVYLMFPFCS